MYEKVKQFRQKMGLSISNEPTLLAPAEASYFARFIMEELSEFLKAHEERNLIDASDAVVDLIYVALGCSHAMGLPFNTLFDIVHHANMEKVPANELQRSKRGKQYDVVKPLGWEAPETKISIALAKCKNT